MSSITSRAIDACIKDRLTLAGSIKSELGETEAAFRQARVSMLATGLRAYTVPELTQWGRDRGYRHLPTRKDELISWLVNQILLAVVSTEQAFEPPEPTPLGERAFPGTPATRITLVIETDPGQVVTGVTERIWVRHLTQLAAGYLGAHEHWHLTVTGGRGNTQLYYDTDQREDHP